MWLLVFPDWFFIFVCATQFGAVMECATPSEVEVLFFESFERAVTDLRGEDGALANKTNLKNNHLLLEALLASRLVK